MDNKNTVNNPEQSSGDGANQWNDVASSPEMEDRPLKIDLSSAEFQNKFADAEIMAKRGTVNAEQISAEGLASGAYADRDVFYDESAGEYKISTYVMREKKDQNGNAIMGVDGQPVMERQWENNHTIKPDDWIITNPKTREDDYPNRYPTTDEKFHKLYDESGQPGVYKAKGLAKLIPNETGRAVQIDLPESWGGGVMDGAQDCWFRQPCDFEGNPNGRPSIIAADAVETTYGPLVEVRPDLVLSASEGLDDQQFVDKWHTIRGIVKDRALTDEEYYKKYKETREDAKKRMEAVSRRIYGMGLAERKAVQEEGHIRREAKRAEVKAHEAELLERGEALVYPERVDEWTGYVKSVVEGDNPYVDVEVTLEAMEQLEQGLPVEDVVDFLKNQDFAGSDGTGRKLETGYNMAYGMARNYILRASKRGPEFWEHSAMEPIPESGREFMEKIKAENEQLEAFHSQQS